MRNTTLAAASLIALACSMGPALSDDASPAWLSGVADQKLIAVDGSSITLSPADDKLALLAVSPAGAEQKRFFTLMNDTMGTVSDADAHVTGFFRVTDTGFEAQFSDGHTETLTLNGAGGVSLLTHGAASGCTSWYPAGHAFSEAERRAAVADYASRLGLSQPAPAKTPHAASCPMQTQRALVQAPSRPMHHGAVAASVTDVVVRPSVIHPIDVVAAAPAAPPALAWSASVRVPAPAAGAPPPAGHGASDCLSVESDGANLGFRNQCGYGVQFAYCLQSASEQPASCDAGSKTGNVSANAFTPVLEGANIKASDAEHDFRWVACSGDAGDVTPHLDRADPPTGRCVRSKSS
jgi:hypothetical protein